MSAPALLALALLAPFALGVAMAARTAAFVRRARRVRARVVSRRDATVDSHDPDIQSESIERLVVELRVAGKASRRVALADAFGGSIAESLVDGEGMVPVLYDPKAPEVVRIDKPWALYFVPAFLCAPALIAALLAGYVKLAG